jgi:putative alpha-1,2-mannosidase
LTGNDDMGTMSSWYVLSSLGLYPTMSGANFFVLASPQFETSTVHLGDYRDLQGGALTIHAPGTSWPKRYIASAKVNGKAWPGTWVSWETIRHGGSITYRLTDKPSDWGTRSQDAPPSVDGHARRVRHND